MLLGNFCVWDLLVSLAQNSSHITAISVTASYFQPVKSRQDYMKLSPFFQLAPPSMRIPPVCGLGMWHLRDSK